MLLVERIVYDLTAIRIAIGFLYVFEYLYITHNY
jgi:hypothetical protein